MRTRVIIRIVWSHLFARRLEEEINQKLSEGWTVVSVTHSRHGLFRSIFVVTFAEVLPQ